MKCENNQHCGITGEDYCQCGEHELSKDPDYKEYSAVRWLEAQSGVPAKQWYLEVKPKEKWDERNGKNS